MLNRCVIAAAVLWIINAFRPFCGFRMRTEAFGAIPLDTGFMPLVLAIAAAFAPDAVKGIRLAIAIARGFFTSGRSRYDSLMAAIAECLRILRSAADEPASSTNSPPAAAPPTPAPVASAPAAPTAEPPKAA